MRKLICFLIFFLSSNVFAADLIDRLAGTDSSRPKINLHRWLGAQRLYALGEWTRAQIATEFDLQGDEATQGVAIANNIDAQSTVLNKVVYILRLESVGMCIEDLQDRLYHNADGSLNRAKIYEDISIS